MNFKCKKCGGNRLEEVMNGVTQYTEILSVQKEEPDFLMDYGENNCEGGDSDTCFYQCMECGEVVETEEVDKLVQIECEDCGDLFNKSEIVPWKYEPEVKLCENCTETRMNEEY